MVKAQNHKAVGEKCFRYLLPTSFQDYLGLSVITLEKEKGVNL